MVNNKEVKVTFRTNQATRDKILAKVADPTFDGATIQEVCHIAVNDGIAYHDKSIGSMHSLLDSLTALEEQAASKAATKKLMNWVVRALILGYVVLAVLFLSSIWGL